MIYNIVLVSAVHQRESPSGIHVFPPSWTTVAPPTPAHPSRRPPSTRFGFSASCSKLPLFISYNLQAFSDFQGQEGWMTQIINLMLYHLFGLISKNDVVLQKHHVFFLSFFLFSICISHWLYFKPLFPLHSARFSWNLVVAF